MNMRYSVTSEDLRMLDAYLLKKIVFVMDKADYGY